MEAPVLPGAVQMDHFMLDAEALCLLFEAAALRGGSLGTLPRFRLLELCQFPRHPDLRIERQRLVVGINRSIQLPGLFVHFSANSEHSRLLPAFARSQGNIEPSEDGGSQVR